MRLTLIQYSMTQTHKGNSLLARTYANCHTDKTHRDVRMSDPLLRDLLYFLYFIQYCMCVDPRRQCAEWLTCGQAL